MTIAFVSGPLRRRVIAMATIRPLGLFAEEPTAAIALTSTGSSPPGNRSGDDRRSERD
jgi:hypothetical protein